MNESENRGVWVVAILAENERGRASGEKQERKKEE